MQKAKVVTTYPLRSGYEGINAYEALSFWLLLEAKYNLGIKLVKELADGKKSFEIGPNKELTVLPSRFRV